MSPLVPLFRLGFRRPSHPESSVLRVLRPGPDEPRPRVNPSRRPHPLRTVLRVRDLLQTTTLNYEEIARQAGVGRASISRWKQDFGWRRPPGAPISTDTVPSERASIRLRARTLHRRAQDLAARYLDELERDPVPDPAALAAALEMLNTARLARLPRRRRGRGDIAPAPESRRPEPPSPPPARPGHDRLPPPHRQEVVDAWAEGQRKSRAADRQR